MISHELKRSLFVHTGAVAIDGVRIISGMVSIVMGAVLCPEIYDANTCFKK